MAYTVFRCDDMPGVDQRTLIKSVLVVNGDGAPIAAENGSIVVIGDLVEGQHDLYKATLATADADVKKCAVLGTPELEYDECHYHNLDEFINKAGKPATAYLLREGGSFGVTAEGFTAAPEAGATVALAANGKISAGTGLGSVLAIENAGRYTYYVIKL